VETVIHLLFLVASLLLVATGQKLLLMALSHHLAAGWGWNLRRSLQMLALVMPVLSLGLFVVTMLPVILVPEAHHQASPSLHQEWVMSIAGLAAIGAVVLITLCLQTGRLALLYLHVYRRTWPAPTSLLEPIGPGQQTVFSKAQVRLWHSTRPFAINLPGLGPGAKGVIVVSSAMVGQLSQEELQAVLWHEASHLKRQDFWVMWLAGWWRLAFFYLPFGKAYFKLLQEEQELACDEQVATQGGNSLALALAGALLKVWEEAAATTRLNSRPNPLANHPGLPGLASENETGLTEQRINRLIELGSARQTGFSESPGVRLVKAAGLLGGSLGLWLLSLGLMHLLMMPLGCAISLGILS
jgi:Zn-dependent protease with chaperone function